MQLGIKKHVSMTRQCHNRKPNHGTMRKDIRTQTKAHVYAQKHECKVKPGLSICRIFAFFRENVNNNFAN